jgi:hypothetical protein
MMPNVHAGGCSCGAIRYEIAAEPIRTFQCQCRDCQRDTGSGHASVMVFPRAAIRITGRATEISRTADTGAQKLKGFCGSCGSTALQQAGIQARHDWHLRRHSR